MTFPGDLIEFITLEKHCVRQNKFYLSWKKTCILAFCTHFYRTTFKETSGVLNVPGTKLS